MGNQIGFGRTRMNVKQCYAHCTRLVNMNYEQLKKLMYAGLT